MYNVSTMHSMWLSSLLEELEQPVGKHAQSPMKTFKTFFERQASEDSGGHVPDSSAARHAYNRWHLAKPT